MVKKNNNKRGIQLFEGGTQNDFESLSFGSNGIVSGKPTKEGFGTVVRAAKGAGRLGGFFVSPVTRVAKKKARGFLRRKRKELFEKPLTTEKLLEQEQKGILKKLIKKKETRKMAKEITKREKDQRLFELVPFK